MAGFPTLRSTYLFLCLLLALGLLGPLGCGTEGTPGQGDDEEASGRSMESARANGAPGRLVIVGGALSDENRAVYEAILDGRSGEGPLCVIPSASGVPQESMDEYVEVFDAFGGPGTATGVLLTVDAPSRANDQSVVEALEGCSGFFFTGGSQSRIMDVFLQDGEATGAQAALFTRFRAGAVVSGSSAGAAIMSDPMIGGGNSQGALTGGIRVDSEGEGVWLTPGLGFLQLGLVDQHFLARGRWARLMVAILWGDASPVGFGIDENTALVVEDGWAEVVGESGVVLMDARDAAREDGGNGGYGIRLYLLGEGDRVEVETGQIVTGEGKRPIAGAGTPFSNPGQDLFAGGSLLRVLFELASATDDRLTFHQDGHFLEFRKGPDFSALGWDGNGLQGIPLGLSLGPFVLSAWRE